MNTERERFIRDPNSREAKIMQDLNGIEDEIAAGEVSIFAVFTAMRQMIMREQAQLTEANRQTELLGNAIQKAKFELSFAGRDSYVKAAQDALNSVYGIQHPELFTAAADGKSERDPPDVSVLVPVDVYRSMRETVVTSPRVMQNHVFEFLKSRGEELT